MFVSKHDIELFVSTIRGRSHVRIEGRYDRSGRIDPNELGSMPWSENVKSLRYRNPTERDEHRDFDRQVQAYAFTEYLDVKPNPIARLAEFYDYQSCEHPSWRESDAFFAICELRVEVLKRLPGMAPAPWGVADESDIGRFASLRLVSAGSAAF
jgi:hypothetical protein